MTKKHYIRIAAVFDAARMGPNQEHEVDPILRSLAMTLCDIFKDDNPNFDKARFLTACGF